MKIPRHKRKYTFGDDGNYYRSLEMAVVGPSRHTRVSMSLMQGSSTANNSSGNVNNNNGSNSNSNNNGSSSNNNQAVLSAPQNYYYSQPAHQSSTNLSQNHPFPSDVQDRPIGYGAFGVVW